MRAPTHTFHHPGRKTSLIWWVIWERKNRKYQPFLSLGRWHSHRGLVPCNGEARSGPGSLKLLAIPVSEVMGVSYLGPALKCSFASRYQPCYLLSIFIRNKGAIFISIFSLLVYLLSSSELRQGKQMLPTALLKHRELGVLLLAAEDRLLFCLHRFSDQIKTTFHEDTDLISSGPPSSDLWAQPPAPLGCWWLTNGLACQEGARNKLINLECLQHGEHISS